MTSRVGDVRVLVVDDDPGIRTSLRLALEDQEYAVLEAGTGERALTATGRKRIGELEVSPSEGTTTLAGEAVHLTKTEFRLLCALAEVPGRVFGREELLREVWDYDFFGDTRIVDVHVGRVRRKLEGDPASPRYLVTVRGPGYKLQP